MNSTSTSFYSKGAIAKPAAAASGFESSSANKVNKAVKEASLSSLWITRAQKIIDQMSHLYSLLDFIEYGCDVACRQLNIYKPRLLKNTTEETLFSASQRLIHEITSLYELYQAYQPDYDAYSYEN